MKRVKGDAMIYSELNDSIHDIFEWLFAIHDHLLFTVTTYVHASMYIMLFACTSVHTVHNLCCLLVLV